ncbi:unnamed protein product [Gongylonema pulchrum]|uniref:Transposase n=1 Tax=Gongylonema pulchrum TaxID=637853 RepID=A0A183DET3_9BILA|nr:unnamed protein product [Gongylonema pulchrum]
MYNEFQRVFSYLPLAAIIKTQFLLVSGGISQWMTCPENISNLQKPLHPGNMKFLERCLVADILFATPESMLR